jgi:hypothetical protein
MCTIKKVGSSDLADGSVTSTKPADSFMKRVTVLDNAAGNAVGWNPPANGFTIVEPDLSINPRNPFLIVEVTDFNGNPQEGFACFPTGHVATVRPTFAIVCNEIIPYGFELQYVVGNLSEHTVQ